MAKIFTVTSGKGGVGKSTFCANIAEALSALSKRVLLIDGDIGLRSLDLLTGVDEMVVYDWLDVVLGRCGAQKALLFCGERVQLLPAPLESPEDLTQESFNSLLNSYKDDYEYIFIDSPAGIGGFTKIYAECSDGAIILATPDEISARAALAAGNAMLEIGIPEDELRLVINRFSKKAVKKSKLLNIDDMIDRTYLRLLGVIPEEPRLTYFSVSGTPVSSLSDAKTAFSDIAGRITGKEIKLYL